eukprot:CAMPEP_0178765812 /NCGR_PEP_ID=MMETSP0744-20121128/18677_1 /TAXON_ID=913974 /ORGANISM="Nitzschia punctata, Strain CCMP561" /LENGTH=357 /DNA_ID=CAMNT_0020421385 /DNA_START=51 /DNA_END=1124 /DNA_ORIENTATION=-
MAESNSEAALARKRRIAMRNQQRSASSEDALDENFGTEPCAKRPRAMDASSEDATLDVEPVTSKPKPHITGIKKQSRYDPGVPMTRDELKAWRKEARRVRNRESAAASRKKNRERITELESELDGIKSKYKAALKVILDLEANRSVSDNASFTPPALLRQDLMELRGAGGHDGGSRPISPVTDFAGIQTVSPPLSPLIPSNIGTNKDLPCDGLYHHPDHEQAHHKSHQHIIDMISRPIAAKIPPGADASVEGNVSCDPMMTKTSQGVPTSSTMWSEGLMKEYGGGVLDVPPSFDPDVSVDAITEYSNSSTSDGPNSDSSCGMNEISFDHDFDDCALGEFLLDTFDGVDVTNMPEIAI